MRSTARPDRGFYVFTPGKLELSMCAISNAPWEAKVLASRQNQITCRSRLFDNIYGVVKYKLIFCVNRLFDTIIISFQVLL